MSIVVPKYRVYDDANSVLPNLALLLMKVPEAAVFRVLGPDPASAPRSASSTTTSPAARSPRAQRRPGAKILTSDTAITLDSTTKRPRHARPRALPPGHQAALRARTRRTRAPACATSATSSRRPAAPAPEVANGATLFILSVSEHFDQINAVSRVENTSVTTNYVQDMTEMLEFSVADLRELRKWGVDKQLRVKERMRDIMKDLNRSLDLQRAAGRPLRRPLRLTAGFDYVVDAANSKVAAAVSGTADLADIRRRPQDAVQERRRAGRRAGAPHERSTPTSPTRHVGLADINLQGQLGGVRHRRRGQGYCTSPDSASCSFYPDPLCDDDTVRFVCTSQAVQGVLPGARRGCQPRRSAHRRRAVALQLQDPEVHDPAEVGHRLHEPGQVPLPAHGHRTERLGTESIDRGGYDRLPLISPSQSSHHAQHKRIGLTVKNILKVGGGSVLASILSLAVYGSVISQGQFIGDSNKNPNRGPRLRRPRHLHPRAEHTYTATGGNCEGRRRADRHRQVLKVTLHGQRLHGSTASLRGLRTGTSVTIITVLDIVQLDRRLLTLPLKGQVRHRAPARPNPPVRQQVRHRHVRLRHAVREGSHPCRLVRHARRCRRPTAT